MVVLTKSIINDLKELRSQVRFRLQFHENHDSIEVRKTAKENRKPQPPAEGLYFTHVEVVDEITKITYVDCVGQEGESEIAIVERAVAEAMAKGRPPAPSDLAAATELVHENARLKSELEKMKAAANAPARSGRRKATAAAADDE